MTHYYRVTLYETRIYHVIVESEAPNHDQGALIDTAINKLDKENGWNDEDYTELERENAYVTEWAGPSVYNDPPLADGTQFDFNYADESLLYDEEEDDS